jgi:hypothetical protein
VLKKPLILHLICQRPLCHQGFTRGYQVSPHQAKIHLTIEALAFALMSLLRIDSNNGVLLHILLIYQTRVF